MKNKFIGFLFLAFMVSGCNLMGGPSGNNIKQSIIDQTPQVALKTMKFEDYGEGDSVLYYLEKGSLYQMAGQHEESQKAYEAAKEKMEALYTTSVSKSTGSVLLNDNATDYEGEAFENIMAHVYQAVDYMEAGMIENAAIITHQLDSKLEQLSAKKESIKNKVYKCDPYASYLSGIIHEQSESLTRWDDARVAYENSFKCYKKSIFNLGVPTQVKHALKKVEKIAKNSSASNNANMGELIFILDEGFVVAKRENSIAVAAGSKEKIRQVKIAIPEYPKTNSHLITEIRIKINGEIVKAERVHDLDTAARITLEERLPAIQARAMARAVKNQLIQKEAGDRGGYFAQLVSVVATNVLEKADVRGWRTLPHTIWMSRSSHKPGSYNIDVELVGAAGTILNIKQYKNIAINKGMNKCLLLRWGATPHVNNTKSANLYLPVI
jgi:hypothetical protein